MTWLLSRARRSQTERPTIQDTRLDSRRSALARAPVRVSVVAQNTPTPAGGRTTAAAAGSVVGSDGPHHQDYAAPNDVEFAFWVGIRGLSWNSRFPPDGGWNSGKAAGHDEKAWNSRQRRGVQPKGMEFRLHSGIRLFCFINAVPAPTAVSYTTPRTCASCGCSRCAAPSAGT